jgi:hypothetical protein
MGLRVLPYWSRDLIVRGQRLFLVAGRSAQSEKHMGVMPMEVEINDVVQ